MTEALPSLTAVFYSRHSVVGQPYIAFSFYSDVIKLKLVVIILL